MESERPIEKLLRAFAKKRREETGAPFELRPDERRRLQKEIARQHEAAAEEGGFFRGLIAFRRLAFVLGVVAIVAILAAMMLPALSKAKSKSSRATALAQRRQAELQRQMEKEESPISSPVAATAPASPTLASKPFDGFDSSTITVTNGFVTGALAKGNMTSDTLTILPNRALDSVALASTDKEKDLKLALPTTNMLAYQWSFATTVTGGETTFGLSDASNAPAGFVTASAGRMSIASNTQRYRRLAPLDQDEASPASNLLTSFSLEWSGTNLTVHDADGSIYTGAVVAATSAFDMPTEAYDDARNRGQLGFMGSNYFFRVEGTNVGLKKPVVFTGTFVSTTNVQKFEVLGGSGIAAPMPKAQPWMGPFDISGTVTTEGKRMEIQAAPAAPAAP